MYLSNSPLVFSPDLVLSLYGQLTIILLFLLLVLFLRDSSRDHSFCPYLSIYYQVNLLEHVHKSIKRLQHSPVQLVKTEKNKYRFVFLLSPIVVSLFVANKNARNTRPSVAVACFYWWPETAREWRRNRELILWTDEQVMCPRTTLGRPLMRCKIYDDGHDPISNLIFLGAGGPLN